MMQRGDIMLQYVGIDEQVVNVVDANLVLNISILVLMLWMLA
jgi:hypothetical protein